MKKYASFILLTLAILAGLGTSFLAYNWLQQRDSVHATAETQGMISVVVAATDLERGTKIRPEVLKQVNFLEGSISADQSFSRMQDAVGRVLLQTVYAGEPILKSRCAPEGVTAGGVGALIALNKRAMTVKVDKVKGVSGFVNPGNMVDVLVTLEKPGKSRDPITKTVLENVPVLASGTELERRGDKEKPVEVDVITLEVSPEEGEKLALASTHGSIQLAMRNHSDGEHVLTKGMTIETLLTSYSPAAPPAKVNGKKVVRRPVDRSHRVEVIRGSTVSKMKF